MSHIFSALSTLQEGYIRLSADDGSIVPAFTPALPAGLKGITGQVIGWAVGIGVALAVLGQVLGWSMIGIGHSTERSSLAARGKQSVIWSLIAVMGLAIAGGLVWLFYSAAKNGGAS